MIHLLLALATAGALNASADMPPKGLTVVETATSQWVHLDSSGRLVYHHDEKGNRIPDFSYVGYHAGEQAIPDVAVRKTLAPEPDREDDTDRLQNALDEMGGLPPDEAGIRGALLLQKGMYRVRGTLYIRRSGIVLRGEGNGPEGTVIVATGYGEEKFQRALIRVGPADRQARVVLEKPSRRGIVDGYVPIGAREFRVDSAQGYAAGDRIVVFRPSTAEWIHSLGTDQLAPKWAPIRDARWVRTGPRPGFYYRLTGSTEQYWKFKRAGETWEAFEKRIPFSEDGKLLDVTQQWEPGTYDFYFERKIAAIDGNRVTIDAPLAHALDSQWGRSAIYHYETPSRVFEVGVENLRLLSEFGEPTPDNPYGDPDRDQNSEFHGWHGIVLGHQSENTWVRNVTANYFGWSLVYAQGRNATIQDCVSLGHVSRITGGRRYPFALDGQLNLFQRCLAINGRHEFVVQARAAGPNVFVDCYGINSKAASGPHHRYGIGTLYDNVRSVRAMSSSWSGNGGTGHGWTGTQTLFYNCTAPGFVVGAPLGGISWVIGCGPDGATSRSQVKPQSLYYQQLLERLGPEAVKRVAPGSDWSDPSGFVPYRWVTAVMPPREADTAQGGAVKSHTQNKAAKAATGPQAPGRPRAGAGS
jgi:hypothetical protein